MVVGEVGSEVEVVVVVGVGFEVEVVVVVVGEGEVVVVGEVEVGMTLSEYLDKCLEIESRKVSSLCQCGEHGMGYVCDKHQRQREMENTYAPLVKALKAANEGYEWLFNYLDGLGTEEYRALGNIETVMDGYQEKIRELLGVENV